jgi:hypothetical protein
MPPDVRICIVDELSHCVSQWLTEVDLSIQLKERYNKTRKQTRHEDEKSNNIALRR